MNAKVYSRFLLFALVTTAWGSDLPERCVVSLEMPSYPALARQARIEGQVQLAIEVDSIGVVISAEAKGGHQLLRDAAVKNVRTWRFRPVVPKESPTLKAQVTFKYKLEGDELYASPCPSRVVFESWKTVEVVTHPPTVETQVSD
jgi:TonB family protein